MFSVVLPTYNNLELFKTALQSVSKQKDCNVEIIVVDDSTSSTIEDYIHSVHNLQNLHYHHNKPSLGAIDNWNYGLSLATGDYVILMHHDEAFEDDYYLYNIEEELKKGADVVVTNIKVMVAGKERKLAEPSWLRKFVIRHPPMLLALNTIGPTACVALKRTLCGPFNTKLHWLVDVEWYNRMLDHRKVSISPDLRIVSQHGHSDQITGNINIKEVGKRDAEEIVKCYKGRRDIRLALWLNKTLSGGVVKRFIRKMLG